MPATRSRATARSGRRPGLFGGRDGRPAPCCSKRGDGSVLELPSKFPYRKAAAGDRLRLLSPCGGGYGDPTERDPESIHADVADGYVSPQSARELYNDREGR